VRLTLAVALFGLFVAALGLVGLLSPARLLDLVTRAQSRAGPYGIAGLRLSMGAVLLLAAPSSRASLYLQILGVLSLISGAATPFVGVRRLEAILAWWRQRAPWVVRIWSVFVLGFGLSLVWAVLPAGPVA
jgi:hypothetical protein